MEAVTAWLDLYGVVALFMLMLVKAVGVPVPIPADLIMLVAAARAAEGRWPLWQVFAALLLAMVVGGIIQFALTRGPGRAVLYRFGRYLGLTPTRLDRAAMAMRRGGIPAISLAILTPGVRSAAVVGCGLAGVSWRAFMPGLVIGSSLFLSLHIILGYIGAAVLSALTRFGVLPWLLTAGVLVTGLAGWLLIRRVRRPNASRAEIMAEAVGAWHEAACPACLLLGAANRLADAPAPAVPAPGVAGWS